MLCPGRARPAPPSPRRLLSDESLVRQQNSDPKCTALGVRFLYERDITCCVLGWSNGARSFESLYFWKLVLGQVDDRLVVLFGSSGRRMETRVNIEVVLLSYFRTFSVETCDLQPFLK